MKVKSNWSDNDVKLKSSWTSVAKKPALFKPIPAPGRPYKYDSAIMTYDSNLWFYDRLVNTNQINQLTITPWAET